MEVQDVIDRFEQKHTIFKRQSIEVLLWAIDDAEDRIKLLKEALELFANKDNWLQAIDELGTFEWNGSGSIDLNPITIAKRALYNSGKIIGDNSSYGG